MAVICLSLASISGCKKAEVPSDDPSKDPAISGTPISFIPEDPFTKAGLADINTLQSEGCKVWGMITSTAHPEGIHQFDESGTDLTYDSTIPGWTYSPVRYWMDGTYNFAAIHPADLQATYEIPDGGDSPVLKVENFDVTPQNEFLVAFNNGIDGRAHPDEVDLTFRHALSNIQIQLSLDKEDFFELDQSGNIIKQVGYAFVSLLGFEGISTKATLTATSAENMIWNSSQSGSQILSYADNMPEIRADWSNFLGGDGMFTIPQSLLTGQSDLYMIVVIYPLGNASDRVTKEFRIPLNSGVSEWIPNTKYIYRGVVTQDLIIDFSVTRVNDWENENLGGFIVS